MRRKILFVAAVLLIGGLALLLGTALASAMEVYVLAQRLQPEAFVPHSDNAVTADVLKDGVRTANIYVRVDPPPPETTGTTVLVAVWHAEETELDSLYVELSSEGIMQYYLKMPEGRPWPIMQFQQTSDAKGTFVRIDDLGTQGSGTVTLEFVLKPFQNQHSFNFAVRFTMHTEALIQLTQQEVQANIDVPLPS